MAALFATGEKLGSSPNAHQKRRDNAIVLCSSHGAIRLNKAVLRVPEGQSDTDKSVNAGKRGAQGCACF